MSDAAYFAGLLDIYGTITLTEMGQHNRPRIDCRNQDRRVLDLLSAQFGGKVCEYRKGATQFFYWQRTYGSAKAVIAQVRPYLRLRTDVADRILRWTPKPKGLPSYRPAVAAWNLDGMELTKAGRGYGRRA